MATKTISLELDAYEKLKRAKIGGESFSAVVRRARFDPVEETEGEKVEEPQAVYGSTATGWKRTARYIDRFSPEEQRKMALKSFDAATKRQEERERAYVKKFGPRKPCKDRGWTREELYEERFKRWL